MNSPTRQSQGGSHQLSLIAQRLLRQSRRIGELAVLHLALIGSRLLLDISSEHVQRRTADRDDAVTAAPKHSCSNIHNAQLGYREAFIE
jgi:hypothetical protein